MPARPRRPGARAARRDGPARASGSSPRPQTSAPASEASSAETAVAPAEAVAGERRAPREAAREARETREAPPRAEGARAREGQGRASRARSASATDGEGQAAQDARRSRTCSRSARRSWSRSPRIPSAPRARASPRTSPFRAATWCSCRRWTTSASAAASPTRRSAGGCARSSTGCARPARASSSARWPRTCRRRSSRADIRFLIEVWNQVVRRNEKRGGPGLLHPDLDLILRATRDLFAHDVEKLVVDDRDEYERILGFVDRAGPGAARTAWCSTRRTSPIFDAYGIEQEIAARHSAQGVAQERRLPDHRSGRGAHRHRRQLRPLRRQEEPRGDDHQDQRRGGQGDRLPAAAAQHRRHHHLRLHRHGEAAEPRQGLQDAAGGAGPRQGQDERAAHLRARPGGDDAQARARVHRPRAARGLLLLRRQGLREDGHHGRLRDLPRDPPRGAAATRIPRWSSTATPRSRGCSRARSGRSCAT